MSSDLTHTPQGLFNQLQLARDLQNEQDIELFTEQIVGSMRRTLKTFIFTRPDVHEIVRMLDSDESAESLWSRVAERFQDLFPAGSEDLQEKAVCDFIREHRDIKKFGTETVLVASNGRAILPLNDQTAIRGKDGRYIGLNPEVESSFILTLHQKSREIELSRTASIFAEHLRDSEFIKRRLEPKLHAMGIRVDFAGDGNVALIEFGREASANIHQSVSVPFSRAELWTSILARRIQNLKPGSIRLGKVGKKTDGQDSWCVCEVFYPAMLEDGTSSSIEPSTEAIAH